VVGLLLRKSTDPQSDELMVVFEHGAKRLSASGEVSTVLPWLSQPVLAVCCDADQAVWAAVALPESGSAIGLVRQDGTLDIRWRIGEPVQCLAWRPADQILYATAPQSGAILVLAVGQGVRRLATVPKGSGRVSGLTFDTDGGIWTALCDGWSLMRFTHDGQVDRVVGLPVPCATDLAFDTGGSGRLMVTTARHSVPLDTLASAPLSGRLLVLPGLYPKVV
jgi:IclR family acetate operon transcriptional repressor